MVKDDREETYLAKKEIPSIGLHSLIEKKNCRTS